MLTSTTSFLLSTVFLSSFILVTTDAQCYFLVPQRDDPPCNCIRCAAPCPQPIYFLNNNNNNRCNCCCKDDDDNDDDNCIVLRIITRSRRYAMTTKELSLSETNVTQD